MSRSVPVTFRKGTALRFDRGDIKAVENALGLGYPSFTRPGIFGSLTAAEAYLWRGLKTENERGELVHVYPLDAAGQSMAGDDFMAFMQDGGDLGALNNAIVEAFICTGLFSRKEPRKEQPEPENSPKNSTT